MDELAITDAETHIVANPWKPWVFVRLHTNEGVTGLAEATAHGKPETVAAAVEEMSDFFVGENPFDTERLWLEMYRDEWFSKNVVNTTVCSAVDMACWDIKGKLLERPVYELLGGSVHGDELRAYANGWYTDTTDDPATWGEAAQRVVDDGYDAMKFDPFGTSWERMDREKFNHASEVVGAVREAVGPDVDLLVEGHGRFTAGQAVEVANELAQYDPTWFEEPCPPDSINSLRKVAEKSPVPIATGERLMTKYSFRDLLARTDVDIIQPDIMNTGGITEAKKIAAQAEAEHVSFAPHNPQGPVATAISTHVDATVPNFMIQEVFQTYDVDWVDDLLVDPITVEDGYVEIPQRPGLGIELDMDVVDEHRYEGRDDESVHTINLFESDWETRNTD
ncbi:mandelate racemase/muconate lactonizing enzyme family protein [Halobacteriales archaeon QS_4_69_31]|jgi:galactonate dehydratase|nr:MAG: mandelate racemase/muconate lactonizing enzyme family protein [Halobacteriales archaeon QS_4_69_31]